MRSSMFVSRTRSCRIRHSVSRPIPLTFALREIEAVRLESGAPAYRFSGATARWVADHGLTAHLSLSHDGGMALAFCILETAPET